MEDVLRIDFDQRMDKLSKDIEQLTQRFGPELDDPKDPKKLRQRLLDT